MRTVRWLLATTGMSLMTVGGTLLFTDTREGTVPQVALWLAGALVLHDLALAPVVLLIGWALVRPPARGAPRTGLMVAGCLTLIALPALLRPGAPSHPSVLPLDYPRDWAVLMAAVTLTMAGALLGRWPRGGTGRGAPSRSKAADGVDEPRPPS